MPRRKSRVPSIGSTISGGRSRLGPPAFLAQQAVVRKGGLELTRDVGLGRAVGRGDGRVVRLVLGDLLRASACSSADPAARARCGGRRQLRLPALSAFDITAPRRREGGSASRSCGRPRHEQPALALQAAAIAGEASVGPDHAVAGNDHLHRVAAVRRDHGATASGSPISRAQLEYEDRRPHREMRRRAAHTRCWNGRPPGIAGWLSRVRRSPRRGPQADAMPPGSGCSSRRQRPKRRSRARAKPSSRPSKEAATACSRARQEERPTGVSTRAVSSVIDGATGTT